MTEEVTVSGASPVVDTKRTTTGATFDVQTLEKIPTARDPWMIIYMAPGVQLAAPTSAAPAPGGQPTISSRGTSANVQWNLEGGATTDLRSNTSASYYNFDSLEQIQVINGGGDVSVQSSGSHQPDHQERQQRVQGLGGRHADQRRDAVPERQRGAVQDRHRRLPVGRAAQPRHNVTFEYGGPIIKNKLWFWGNADHQDINTGVLNYYDASKSPQCAAYADAQRLGTLAGTITYDDLDRCATA